MKKITIYFILLFCTAVTVVKAQSAKELHETAKSFMQQGDYSNAILVLNKAAALDPSDLDITKDSDPINRLHELYASRIAGNIFKYVSNPKVLKNNSGSPLFHFFMATNNEIALRIANSVVNPKLGF